MSKLSWSDVRQQVVQRANGCCEYCQTCSVITGQTMQVDHIDPSGGDALNNLALACWNCNNHKRQAVQAIDPDTDELADLYHPRQQLWDEHFEWVDDFIRIRGRTPTGRATIVRLKMNRPLVVHARQRWVEFGFHPPKIDA